MKAKQFASKAEYIVVVNKKSQIDAHGLVDALAEAWEQSRSFGCVCEVWDRDEENESPNMFQRIAEVKAFD